VISLKIAFKIIIFCIIVCFTIRVIKGARKRFSEYYNKRLNQKTLESLSPYERDKVRRIMDASSIFRRSPSELIRMPEYELSKLYKQLCKIHHPDHGGREENFKKLSESYNFLKSLKKGILI